MKTKTLAVFLAALLLLSCLTFSAFAQEEDDAKDSDYFKTCTAVLQSTGTTGQLKLSFYTSAKRTMQTLGVLGLFVRDASGIQQVVWGSTANGLLAQNTTSHFGSWTFNLTSGTSYNCSVVFYAQDASGNETRTLVTSTVVCP